MQRGYNCLRVFFFFSVGAEECLGPAAGGVSQGARGGGVKATPALPGRGGAPQGPIGREAAGRAQPTEGNWSRRRRRGDFWETEAFIRTFECHPPLVDRDDIEMNPIETLSCKENVCLLTFFFLPFSEPNMTM